MRWCGIANEIGMLCVEWFREEYIFHFQFNQKSTSCITTNIALKLKPPSTIYWHYTTEKTKSHMPACMQRSAWCIVIKCIGIIIHIHIKSRSSSSHIIWWSYLPKIFPIVYCIHFLTHSLFSNIPLFSQTKVWRTDYLSPSQNRLLRDYTNNTYMSRKKEWEKLMILIIRDSCCILISWIGLCVTE